MPLWTSEVAKKKKDLLGYLLFKLWNWTHENHELHIYGTWHILFTLYALNIVLHVEVIRAVFLPHNNYCRYHLSHNSFFSLPSVYLI